MASFATVLVGSWSLSTWLSLLLLSVSYHIPNSARHISFKEFGLVEYRSKMLVAKKHPHLHHLKHPTVLLALEFWFCFQENHYEAIQLINLICIKEVQRFYMLFFLSICRDISSIWKCICYLLHLFIYSMISHFSTNSLQNCSNFPLIFSNIASYVSYGCLWTWCILKIHVIFPQS